MCTKMCTITSYHTHTRLPMRIVYSPHIHKHTCLPTHTGQHSHTFNTHNQTCVSHQSYQPPWRPRHTHAFNLTLKYCTLKTQIQTKKDAFASALAPSTYHHTDKSFICMLCIQAQTHTEKHLPAPSRPRHTRR